MGETQLDKLQIAQNRAMRVILQCDRYTKVEYMLQTLQFMSGYVQVMSVRERLYYNICIFIFKILKNMLPNQLRNKLEIVGSDGERQTRQAGDIAI